MDQDVWIAEMETRHTKSRGVGRSPEEAVQSLLDRWRDWSNLSESDPNYPVQYRDGISIECCEFGKGYVKGPTDELWHEDVLSGDDKRFDEIFQAYSEGREPGVSTLP